MIEVTLPDGSKKQYKKPITGVEIAKSISDSLAKEALAIKIDDSLKDLQGVIDKDCQIKIITKHLVTSNCRLL